MAWHSDSLRASWSRKTSQEKKRLQKWAGASVHTHTPKISSFASRRARKSRFSSSAHHEIGNLARVSRGQIKNVSCARTRTRPLAGLTNVLSESTHAEPSKREREARRPSADNNSVNYTEASTRNYFGAARKQCISWRKTIQMYACVSFDLWCWVSHAAAAINHPKKRRVWLDMVRGCVTRSPLLAVLFLYSLLTHRELREEETLKGELARCVIFAKGFFYTLQQRLKHDRDHVTFYTLCEHYFLSACWYIAGRAGFFFYRRVSERAKERDAYTAFYIRATLPPARARVCMCVCVWNRRSGRRKRLQSSLCRYARVSVLRPPCL